MSQGSPAIAQVFVSERTSDHLASQSGVPAPLPSRVCQSCGRAFAWRKKWARDWEQVRYCSKACRSSGHPGRLVHCLAERLTEERLLALDTQLERSLGCGRERLRSAARLLAQAGSAQLLHQGKQVSPNEARGALTLRRT